NVSDKSLHKYFTYSPELYYLFEDLTILEYFEFVKKAYCINEESNIFELIKIFDLEEKLNNFISTLSNGMKKKVSHIAAFFPNTPFCILDEPFSGLDPIAIYNLKKYIKDTFKKRTYIISTHQLAILDSINIPSQDVYLVLMNKGEVVFNGSKEQLLYDDKYKNIEQAYISLIEGGQ
uniref:ATP-binding cassette domain-containing protein n=1 Tax=Candidatus Ruminimicrobium bovinum TaxID=3242779 RepID=UPI0039B8EFBD